MNVQKLTAMSLLLFHVVCFSLVFLTLTDCRSLKSYDDNNKDVSRDHYLEEDSLYGYTSLKDYEGLISKDEEEYAIEKRKKS